MFLKEWNALLMLISGNWDKVDTGNPLSVLSRIGLIIFIHGCPFIWISKLQTKISLSVAEGEYITLIKSTKEVIPLVNLLNELNNTLTFGIKDPDFTIQNLQ